MEQQSKGNGGKLSGPRPISAEAEVLARRISKLEAGEPLSYDEMSRIIGQDIRERRGALTTACNKALRESGVAVMTIRGVGIKRLTGVDYADVLAKAQEASRRKQTRELKKSLAMPQEEYEALSAGDKIRLDARRALAAALIEAVKPKLVGRLEGAVADAGTRIPPGRAFIAMIAGGE